MSLRSLLFAALGAALLVVLFVAYQPERAPVPQPVPAVVTESSPAPQSPQPFAVFSWEVRDGQVTNAPAAARVRQGDRVVLRLLSDHADELHLHGYDLALKLEPGVEASLEFEALHSGRFELELHHAHRELGVIEVLPR